MTTLINFKNIYISIVRFNFKKNNIFVFNEIKFLCVNFDNTFHDFIRVFKSYPTTWMRKNKFHEQVHIFVGYPPQGRYMSTILCCLH